MRNAHINVAVIGLAHLFLSGCGGGGGGPATPPAPPPVAKTDVVALGPLQSSTPFTLNEVSYSTAGASVEINGAPGSIADLKSGHMITLTGESAGGAATALEIEYHANVVGPVEAVDSGIGIAIVMGQRIRITPQTHLDAAFTDSSVGANAEVSGHIDALGDIVATRVELVADGGLRLVRGAAGYVDATNFLLRIGGLTVDYSTAQVIDVPDSLITEGIELVISGALDGSGVLVAERLDALARDTAGVAGFEGSLAGVITRLGSATDFDVAGLGVRANGQTIYLGGDVNDLSEGVSVRIEGRVGADGVLDALRVFLSTLATLPGDVTFDIVGFTGVRIDGPFQTVIDRGQEFSVQISIDEDSVDLLDVRREGGRLRIGFLDGVSVNVSRLQARVVMPELDSLALAGATFATVRGFEGPQLDVDLAGAVLLVVNDSRYDNLSANLTGACALLMEDSTIVGAANVDIVAASAATLNLAPGARLDGALVAASALLYYGDNIDVDVSSDFTSEVVRVGGSL